MKKYPTLQLLGMVVVLALAPTRALIAQSGDEQEIKRVYKQLIDADCSALLAWTTQMAFSANENENGCGEHERAACSNLQGRKNYGRSHSRPENKAVGAGNGPIAALGFHGVSRAVGPR